MRVPLRRLNIVPRLKAQIVEYYQGWVESDEKLIETSKKFDNKNNLYKHSVDLLVGSIKRKQERQTNEDKLKQQHKIDISKLNNDYTKLLDTKTVEYKVEKDRLDVKHKEECTKLKEKHRSQEELNILVREKDRSKHERFVNFLQAEKAEYVAKIGALKTKYKNIEALHANQALTLIEKDKEFEKLEEDHTVQLELRKLSEEALEKRYKVALIEEKVKNTRREFIQEELNKKNLKRYKWLATCAYLLTPLSLAQILWMIIS